MYCFSQFCRLCVRTDLNLVNIFYIDDDLQSLSDKMRSILPEIIYEEDNIPNFVCELCCSNVKKMYEFRKKCLKNNEILKLYSSKLLSMKEAPENINLENEIKLIQKQISEENIDVNLSLVRIKQEIEPKLETDCKTEPETSVSDIVKDEHRPSDLSISFNFKNDPLESDQIKSEENHSEASSPSSPTSSDSDQDHQEFDEPELVVNKRSNTMEETRTYSRRTVIGSNLTIDSNDNREHEPDLKLECTEEDDDLFSEDQGDESMDCDEVISIIDSENDNADEDIINIPEPMNLTAKALDNPLIGSLDSPNMSLPPHLASGNREFSWAVTSKNKCAYYGCSSTVHDRKEITLFRFPIKNKERLEKWIKSIGNATLKTFSIEQLTNHYVCGKHFRHIDFRANTNNTTRLNSNAVPIPFLPGEIPPEIDVQENIVNDCQPIKKEIPEKEIPEIDIQEVKPVKKPIFTYSRKRKLVQNNINLPE